MIENTWHKNKEVECLDCGFNHKTTRHIYFEQYSVSDNVGLCFRDGLRCNKCGNETNFHIRDKRAKKILNKWLKMDVNLTTEDRILYAMDEYCVLIQSTNE